MLLTSARDKKVSMKCPHCAARIFAQPQQFIDLFRCPQCKQSGFFVNAAETTHIPSNPPTSTTSAVIAPTPPMSTTPATTSATTSATTPPTTPPTNSPTTPTTPLTWLMSVQITKNSIAKSLGSLTALNRWRLWLGGGVLAILTTLFFFRQPSPSAEATIAAAVTSALVKHEQEIQLRDLTQRNHEQAVQLTAQTLRVQKLEQDLQALRGALEREGDNFRQEEFNARAQKYDWLNEREKQLTAAEAQLALAKTELQIAQKNLRGEAIIFAETMRGERKKLDDREQDLRAREEKFHASMLDNIRAVREAEAKVTKERKAQVITVAPPSPPMIIPAEPIIIHERTPPLIIRETVTLPLPYCPMPYRRNYHPPLLSPRTVLKPLPQKNIGAINKLSPPRLGQMPRR